MQSSRTDSINSTTVFVNPNDIQPRNSHRYSGVDISLSNNLSSSSSSNQHHSNYQPAQVIAQPAGIISGTKRRHSDSETSYHPEAKVIVLGPDGTIQNLPDDMYIEDIDIPLGGTAGMEIQSAKIEYSNQDSNHSWSSSIQQDHSHQQHPSPTSADPSTIDYLGQHRFEVSFAKTAQGSKNKHWDYSSRLKKLYIDMNKLVQVEFRVGENPPEGLQIRALPIYADPTHLRDPVKRCPNHASENDPTNADFFYHRDHLIRIEGEGSFYEEDPESNRLSVVFPVQKPHQGTDKISKLLKFMCLGSDIGGINRRPVKVIFTLEEMGQVVGRKVRVS